MCRLRHMPLLDAAHIIPDRGERGLPEVPNGLALCRIHHGARLQVPRSGRLKPNREYLAARFDRFRAA